MKRTRITAASLTMLISLLSQFKISIAASAPLEKLTIGWSAVAGSQAPFWITKEAGLFEKNGLDVIMIYLDGGSRATQAMMSGDLPIAQVGGNAPVVAKLRGADVTLISGLLNVLAYSMVVSPEIKRPEDLRDKKLTVSRFGSNSDYATRKILLKWGLKPDVDVAILQSPGGPPTRLAAIQTKQVHGMVAQPLIRPPPSHRGSPTFVKSATPRVNSPGPCSKASTCIRPTRNSAKKLSGNMSRPPITTPWRTATNSSLAWCRRNRIRHSIPSKKRWRSSAKKTPKRAPRGRKISSI